MNWMLASLINTLMPAMAVAAALEVLFRIWKGLNAATRYTVWWIALAAVLTMPLVWRPEPRAEQLAQRPHAAVTSVQTAQPAQTASPTAPAFDVEELLFPLMGAGIAAYLAQILASFFWVRRTKRHAEVASRSHRLDYLMLRYGIGRGIRLLESSSVQSPMAVGFRRPAILLPTGLADRLSVEELDHVLLHELAHLLRRDDWWNLIAQIVRSIAWFHPAVRWIVYWLEHEREMACDDWAAGAAGEHRRYAASLTRLVELRLEARHVLLATGALGKPRLTRRIESLLKAGLRPPGVSFPKVLASFAAVSLLSVLCSNSPELVAADRSLEMAERVQGPSFLDGMAGAGYASLSVEELIELRNNGVSPEYAGGLADGGLAKLQTQQLIELRRQGVEPRFVQSVHGMGFGPYPPEQLIEFVQRGVDANFFRHLKEAGVVDLSPKDIVEAVAQGIRPKDIESARRYHPEIEMQQIIKLKQAGVF